jgi:hypothetical protein
LSKRFSAEVESILRRGGWFEGRRVDLAAYDRLPVKPHAKAREVLTEFGGLRVGEHGPGIDFVRTSVDFVPPTVFEFDALKQAAGSSVYWIARAYGSDDDLWIDEDGGVYAIHQDLLRIALSFDAALESLLLGRRDSEAKWLD